MLLLRPMIEQQSYSLNAVMAITGAKRSQVENWVRSAWLVPEGRVSSGTGEDRLYSFPNLVDVSIGVRLSRFHIPLRALFRDLATIGTLRALVPDASEWHQMTDEQLVALHTEGWTEDDWQDALQQPIDSGDRWTKEQYCLRAIIGRYRAGAEKWLQFIDPQQRPKDAYQAIVIYYFDAKYKVNWHPETERVYDSGLVINLATIFRHLEDATGDQWGQPR